MVRAMFSSNYNIYIHSSYWKYERTQIQGTRILKPITCDPSKYVEDFTNFILYEDW